MRPYVLKFVLTLIEATLEGAPALLHSSLCCAHLSASRRASDSAGRTPWYLAAQPDSQPPFSFSVSAARDLLSCGGTFSGAIAVTG
jgi:hypothetical protein